jgi:hypothetical protein
MADGKKRLVSVIMFEPGWNGAKKSGVRDGLPDPFNPVLMAA